ncbi:hypothetical protein HGRIS_005866 [Hohenbuehelia grisea]|uniref:Glycosyltransferase 61 catalytic domain-containing protein n=1 Tax=Hohenbuehelia grisea TaxID=104357 RepID=A0ABR3K093_9AGAR
MSWAPTGREIVLLTTLWLFILFIFHASPQLDSFSPLPFIYNRTATVPFDRPQSKRPVPQLYNTHHTWGSSKRVPATQVLAHVPGWTIFDRLYLVNGTFFVVTDEPNAFPTAADILSNGLPIELGEEDKRLPTRDHIQIVSTKEARVLFGPGAHFLDGVTFAINDPPQFIRHYYHWSAELWFGFWRTYSTLAPSVSPSGHTPLPPPRRLLFTRLDGQHWRDYAAMNEWVIRSSMPGLTMEFAEDFRERAAMRTPVVFERVVVADRSAAMPAYNYQRFQRTAAVPAGLPGSVYWWMTIRNSVIGAAGVDPRVGSSTTDNPVITYISRQDWGRRMLIPADHEKLVKALHKLRDDHGYEVNIVSMDKMSRAEQLRLAARTTIMMGVHGNGLTSLLWMNPNPRSTVMEFFFPGGFAYDYEYTARALGMTHYGFWGSKYFTSPDMPPPAYPEGFQGTEIPIDGEVVARLCHERLSLVVELDD